MEPSISGPAPAPARIRSAGHRLRRELLPMLALLLLLGTARASFANHYHVPSGSQPNRRWYSSP